MKNPVTTTEIETLAQRAADNMKDQQQCPIAVILYVTAIEMDHARLKRREADLEAIISRLHEDKSLLLGAVQDLVPIAQASIVNARKRGDHPQIIVGLERREKAAREAIQSAERPIPDPNPS